MSTQINNDQQEKLIKLGVFGIFAYGAVTLGKRIFGVRENPEAKVYDATGGASSELKSAIKNVLQFHDKYKKSYFWTGTGSANQRRSQEASFASDNPPFVIKTEKDEIEVYPELSISARNFYYSLHIAKNGKKSNITALKKFLK